MTEYKAIWYHTIQAYEHNKIMKAHISKVEMGVEPLTCGLSEFYPLSQTSPREEEIVTGLAVYIVISTTPTLQHFSLFHSRSIPSSLFPLTTHTHPLSLPLSLYVWTMPLWQGPRIADDVTQELCGSPDCGHSPQSMLGQAVIKKKLWQSVASWCNHFSSVLRSLL